MDIKDFTLLSNTNHIYFQNELTKSISKLQGQDLEVEIQLY
ncbi:hypothetical protein Ctaglu_20340 [Clostridium tagluense]|uniref:Uncharacterized protein n=1 Tax=Clostridium tagluense TaxID=360422 RepID=A0A401ULK6_9CLOT|nr:hypothetical protein Ctaglu_20340 [Clostridium tagluense]